MRAVGAITLLIVWVDTDTILLVGIWCSNLIIRYPHTLPQGFTSGFAALVVQHEEYAPIPTTHGGYHPASLSMGLSQAFFRVKLGAYHSIGEGLTNKTRLIIPSDAWSCIT